MSGSGGVEQPPLPGPVQRDLSDPKQLAPRKRWRMQAVEDGSEQVGRQPADPQQLPSVPFAVVRYERIGLSSEY